MKIKALISAGGRGTRLRPITHTQNKHLIPIANKPMIFYPIESIVSAGIMDIGVVVNPESAEEIKNVLGDGKKWNAHITYITQPYPGGVAHIAYVAKDFIGKSKFFLHLGDNVFRDGIKKPLDKFLRTKANGLVTILRHKENRRLGVPYFDKAGKLVDIKEKPQNPPHDFCVPGLYFLDHHFFECFENKDKIKPSARGEYEIPDVYKYLIDKKYKVETCEVSGWWHDPGKSEDLMAVNRTVLDDFNDKIIDGNIDEFSNVVGRIRIEKGTQIINSTIRGPVVIGKDCIIKNSFIGPYTSIYHNCTIINSEIEDSVVLTGVTIENIDARIGASIIGNNATVTKGKKALPKELNFFIGDNCIIDLI